MENAHQVLNTRACVSTGEIGGMFPVGRWTSSTGYESGKHTTSPGFAIPVLDYGDINKSMPVLL